MRKNARIDEIQHMRIGDTRSPQAGLDLVNCSAAWMLFTKRTYTRDFEAAFPSFARKWSHEARYTGFAITFVPKLPSRKRDVEIPGQVGEADSNGV